MQAREVRSAADARRIVEERGLRHVKVGLTDVDGVLRGKYMSRDKFFSALEGGFGFCDVVLGWDSNDQLVDNLTYTGWHTAYPDAPARIVPESCRDFLFEETAHTVREKNYRDLKPISPGFFGYSVLRNSVFAEFYHELLGMCETMDMSLEGLHTETGAGVLEAAIGVDRAIASADKAALFKTFCKV